MTNQIVKSREFENSKKKLQKFSKRIPSTSRIPNVAETTFFGILNSNVTGEDLNKVVKTFQDRSIQTNEYLRNITKEFETIYDTFESLDKDYIQSIIIAIKSAEESSKQADKNYKITESLIIKLQYKFEKIESLYDVIKSDVNSVSNASENLKNIKHLKNIDTTYIQAFENKTTITELNNSLINSSSELQKNIDKTTQGLDTIRVKQNEFKLDVVERLKVSTENSLKINKEFSNKMAKDLYEIRVIQNDLKSDIIERININTNDSIKKNEKLTYKMNRGLDEIRIQQKDLKLDIVEKLKVSNENSLKNNKVYFDEMNRSLDEIRVQQRDLKADIIERLNVETEKSLNTNKEYSNKITLVSVIAVISLILSISIIVINLMNDVS